MASFGKIDAYKNQRLQIWDVYTGAELLHGLHLEPVCDYSRKTQ